MPPLNIMIKPVSGKCNMRCAYCFYADEMKMREVALYRTMDDVTLDRLIRRAFAYADGQVTFAFQGGEPTLAGPEFYKKVIALENRYNGRRIRVNNAIQTNGYRLDEALIPVLKQGNFLAGVSLDGTEEIHDARRRSREGQPTYARVKENIGRLRAADIPYNVLCVVDDLAASHAQEVFDALKEHVYLQFIPCLDDLDRTEGTRLSAELYGEFLAVTYRSYASMLRKKEKISVRLFDNWLMMLRGYPPESCGTLGRCSANFLVEGNGNVYPCDFYALDEWLMGNINRQSFYALAASDTQKRFIRESLKAGPECASCPCAFFCRGGCKRESPLFHRTGFRQTKLCRAYRGFFEKYGEDMRRLSLSL